MNYVASLYNHQLPQTENKIYDQPGKEELRKKLRASIMDVKFNKNATFALSDDLITDFYEKQLVSKPRFNFIKYSKFLYDFRSTGEFVLDIVLPVDNHLNRNKIFDTNCLRTYDLPKFYQDKPRE